ncbi:ComEA family DNA-binding protein [Aquicella lusitana]|uniref:ComEA protein n=1 Tax=Aquicella lusitana TaxID=254246 RepID=A0A370GNP8_9COXI|nr:helix-hairpin-helix domain-containing protein [Aquicella lusitana]RDI45141.1 comEA protein [Aquicella lusitana]VVC72789.1 ComE operon protein 1 [Aquicella lusitana]
MSFYRTLVAAVAAIALSTPVFADDAANAAQTPADNNQAVQLAEGSQQMDSTEGQSTSTEQTKVNLNNATVKELMKVKGINAAKARAIVAYRKKNGGFKSVDDLAKVKGFKKMKPETMKEIQDQVTVE